MFPLILPSICGYLIDCINRYEKGIRCKSGTIPVAVIPLQLIICKVLLESATTVLSGWEGIHQSEKSEDLPQIQKVSMLSGERQ